MATESTKEHGKFRFPDSGIGKLLAFGRWIGMYEKVIQQNNDADVKRKIPSPSGGCSKRAQPLHLYARSLGAPGEGWDEGT